jgi:hypothetical protein
MSIESALTSILATHIEKFIILFVPDIVIEITEESIEMVAIGTVDFIIISGRENGDGKEDVPDILATVDTEFVLVIVDFSEEFV